MHADDMAKLANFLDVLRGRDQPTWVPLMSGFGGINVAMFPNGVTWYNIADDGKLDSIDFAKPAIEIAELGGYCGSEP